jgi:nucleotide-binding universal stress UspA family protein
MEDGLDLSTLMVCMRPGRPHAGTLAVAADLAERLGSSVIGIAARQVSAHPGVRGAGLGEPHDYEPHRFAEQAEAAEQELRARLSGVKSVEWRAQMTFGPAWEFVAAEARAADLVIAAIDGADHSVFASGQMEVGDLLMRMGRPILIAPQGATGFAFRQALVCFKDAREARRALADALPVLKAMTRVNVMEIVEGGGGEEAERRLNDLKAWLDRHGVKADCAAENCDGRLADQLDGFAREMDADLIVAGAFGHSRLREWAFGGVTRDLLLRGERCVLASH